MSIATHLHLFIFKNREAGTAFRDLMLELTEGKVDPFKHMTIASVTMQTFK